MRGFWRHLDQPHLGPAVSFSRTMREQLLADPGMLPDLRSASRLVVATDFSGEDAGSRCSVVSLLIGDLDDAPVWKDRRREIRARWLPDGRRMSFKALNDACRRKALIPFLQAAGFIPGLLATIAVPKSMRTLFAQASRAIEDLVPGLRTAWKPKVMERLLRVVHLASFFLGGLCAPGQDILLLTDHDAIAANEDKLADLKKIFEVVSTAYIQFQMGQLHCMTAACDDDSKRVEDLLALPDLAAGAVSAFLTSQHPHLVRESPLWRPILDHFPSKTRLILDWVAHRHRQLRSITTIITPGDFGQGMAWHWLRIRREPRPQVQ